ncbi:MAG: hypothetical protein JW959_09610 [Pirellulales bacterium]|nr:hypothetical protein [Pirellulales bacterium]
MKNKKISLFALAMCFAAGAICAAAPVAKKEFSDPREQFGALGVEEKYFAQLADGKRISKEERETLLRIMFRLRIFPPLDLESWALDSGLLQTAARNPKDYRGQIFRLRGRVLEVRPHKPHADAAERYELPEFHLCQLKLDEFDQPVVVFTENVPSQWRLGAKPDADGGALGVFLKLVKGDAPIFVAPRLAWYPNDLLGRLGMDVGLLDTVVNQEKLVEKDRHAFYSMLAAVGRAKPGQLLKQAEENLPKIPATWRWTDEAGQDCYSVVPLFNDAVKNPKSQQGRLVALRGTTRLVEKVLVEPEIAAQYGFDHYYQLMLFTEDSQGNPLTFCLRELPKGMPFGNIPQYAESVYVAGFFFKTWSYDIRKPSDEPLSPGESKVRRQLSPLLIGSSLVWRPPPPPASQTQLNVIIGGLFIAAMIVIWIVAWRSMRRERHWVDKAIGGPPTDFTPPNEK